MNIAYCHTHDLWWDSDYFEICPECAEDEGFDDEETEDEMAEYESRHIDKDRARDCNSLGRNPYK